MGLFGSSKKKELIPEVASYQTHSQRQENYQNPNIAQPPSQQQFNPNNNNSSSSQSIRSQAPSYRTTASSNYVPPSQGGTGYSGSQSQWAQPQQRQNANGTSSGNGRDWNSPQSSSSGGRYGDSNQAGGGGGQQRSQYGNNQQQQQQQPQRNGYGSSKDRSELLAGAPALSQDRYGGPSQRSQQSSSNNDNYGGGEGEQQELNEEDEEVEGIKQQLRFTKQESLASTRNALRIAQEAEETSRATLDRLGDQSDRIANTERHLDLAKAHNERAQDETKELEALNRSIFRPSFTFNKNRKRDAEELRILNRHNAEKADREETRRDQYESRSRIESTYSSMDRTAENASGARMRAKARGAERGRYQFEATESDDEVEDEIDNNLDEMSSVVGRLKLLAMTAGNEVDAQNLKLSKLGGKVDELDTGVHKSTARLARVK